MKKKKLLSLLNFQYIILAGAIIFISFVSSLLFNFHQINSKSEITTKVNFEKLSNLISNDLYQIKQLSRSITDDFISDDSNTAYKKILAANDLIGQIIVYNANTKKSKQIFTNETKPIIIQDVRFPENGYATVTFNDSTTRTCFIKKTAHENSVLVILKNGWLTKYVDYPGYNNTLSLLFFVGNADQIDHSLPSFPISPIDKKQFIQYLTSEALLFAKNTASLKYTFNKNEKTVQLYVKNILDNDCIIALIVPHQSLLGFDSHMFFVYLISGIFLFIGTSLLIVFINSRFTKPFSEISSSVRLTRKIVIDELSDENELDFIGKYITKLENQLTIYEHKFEKIIFENKGLENDLKLANRLQKNLFPSNTLRLSDHMKFDIYAYSESAYDVGGDLYDCFLIDDDHLFVAVADVAGKGIAASLYMIYTHTLLRSLVKPGVDLTEVIQHLNNILIEENISDMFVTIFVGILTLSSGSFEYCNAAHKLPCMISVTGSVDELPETHGIPIGIYPNRVYNSTSIILNDGDQLLIYTDGLTDSVDENGVKYSLDVLKYNLMGAWFSNAKEVTDRIKNSVEEFRGINKPVDDITILTLKYTPSNQAL
jgi:serine phosphatase RsbU (regulator of sigma subunit)